MSSHYLGLDLGTSSIKAVAIDEDCRIVARAGAVYPTRSPWPGAAEQEPADWIAAAREALGTLAGQLPADATPRALGLSGQLPTLVLLDPTGKPIAPAIVWYDGRAEAEAAALLRRVDAAAWYRRSGIVLDAHYLAPMYAWLAQHQPATLARPHRLCGAKDALLFALTGVWATDPSTASGYGVYDPVAGCWDADLCAAAGLDAAQLPPIHDPWATAGVLRAEWLATGLPTLPVVVGAGDALAGVLGCGAARAGTLAAITGTSTSLVVSTATPLHDPRRRFLLSPHALPDLWALEMDLLATGSAVRWLAATLGLEVGDLLAHAAKAPEGANGVVALPYLAGGEQGALWDEHLPAAFIGLSLASTPGDLAGALLEGIAFEMRRCLLAWREAGTAIEELVLTGGLDAPVFAAITAAVLGLPVRVPRRVPASAYGAALLAGMGDGAWSADQAREAGRRHWGVPILPTPRAVDAYAVRYERYARITAAVRTHMAAES